MLTADEKKYLQGLVKRELELFRKDEKSSARETALSFLKAEHEYGHFLERVLKKLQ